MSKQLMDLLVKLSLLDEELWDISTEKGVAEALDEVDKGRLREISIRAENIKQSVDQLL